MKREDLINAIDELKDCESIEVAINDLICKASEFCDHYEHKFNEISNELNPLTSNIDIVFNANAIAERCSKDLY